MASARRWIGSGMVAEKRTVWRRDGKLGEDAANVGHKAHVEHPIGLVEHEGLDGPQVDELLAHQVDQPARSGDEDLDALAQGDRLGPLADAAIDHRMPLAGKTAVRPEALADLDGQFPGRGEHENADGAGERCEARGEGRGRGVWARRCRMGSAKAAVLPVPV